MNLTERDHHLADKASERMSRCPERLTAAPDSTYTVQGYEAYYGDLTVDDDAGTFDIEIESAAARDLIGQTFTRNFEVTEDTLVLTPTDASEGWRVTYERISD